MSRNVHERISISSRMQVWSQIELLMAVGPAYSEIRRRVSDQVRNEVRNLTLSQIETEIR